MSNRVQIFGSLRNICARAMETYMSGQMTLASSGLVECEELLSQTNFLTFRDLFAHGICYLCHIALENP